MNKKQLFIVLCLFIISLSAVSVVSATDNMDNVTMSSTANDVIQVTNTQEDLLTDSAGTFTQLNEKIQGAVGNITLDKNYTYASGDSILSNGITIDRDIAIDGAGYTIDGANQASIFNICGNSNVVLKNINFVNANGNDGAALKVTTSGNVEIFNSHFINNTAFGDGGAIYINATSTVTSTSTISEHNFKIVDSIFTNNIAGDDGGAIYTAGDSGIIYNTMFFDNKGISADKTDGDTSSTRGGSICLTGSDITISKSSFISSSAWMADGKNASKVDGGAIFITGDNVDIVDTTFNNCSATHDGGAIYIIGNNTFVDNCTFDDCTVDNCGGVIYVEGNNVTINGSTLTNNKARLDGGSIYVAGDDGKLYNSLFINNTAGDDGGAIYWEGQRGIMNNITGINNKGISEGNSSSRGGTICLTGSDVTVTKSSFTHSSVTIDTNKDDSKVDGGAIFITGNNVDITDTAFDDCNATHGGGAIYIIGNNTLISGCAINDCTAVYGGSICIEGHDAHILQSNITDSISFEAGGVYVNGPNTVISANFVNCIAGDMQNNILGSGGAIYISGVNTNIIGSTFLNSTAYGGDGGAVYIGGFNTTIQESDFKSTSAKDGKGGAIYIAGDSANIFDSTFNEAQAEYGGAIYIGGYRTGRDAKVLNCKITSATSDADGGAIYVAGNNAIVSANIKDTKALGLNAGKGSGGAIYVGGDYSNITASTFENCSAGLDSYGGAIYIEGDEANIEKSTFQNTYAVEGSEGAAGGAIAIEGEDAVVTDSEFTECYAREGGVIFVKGGYAKINNSNMADSYAINDGGAVYILDGVFTKIFQTTFDNCSAINNDGGAVYIDGYGTTINGAEFIDCSASSQNGAGGAIYIKGKDTKITNALFDSCASVDGGAIYIDGDDVKISDSEFKSNRLVDYSNDDNYGGAIYVNGARAVISTSTFEGHSAFTGGSIYINGIDTTIIDSNFTKSTADYGGAIFIQGANAKISGSDISEASSKYDGGAIYVNGTNALISADFTECNAENGGAIYVSGTNANITDSTFQNCIAMDGGNGGAIFVAGMNTNVENSKFNNVRTCDDGQGGAIYIEGASAKVSESEFENTHAHDGGAIYIEGNDTKIENVDIVSSYATNNGGAIYVHGVRTIVNDSTFTTTNTQNDGVGGAINIVGENTTIINSNFTDSNSAAGGAIYVTGDNAAITGSHFSDISSDTSGGAIYVAGENTRISQDTFDSCHSLGAGDYSGGGAIYVAGDDTSISASEFTDSTSKGHGGAIYVAGKNTNIADSKFTSNHAEQSAGAIYISKYNVTVNEKTVIVEAQNTTIEDCLFDDNSAVISGGAVRVSGTNTTILRSHFDKNKVTAGYSGDSKGIGGALYIDGINATVQYSSFTENTAVGRGGAIFWNGGHGGDSIIGSNFTRNKATSNDNALGGAVYWSAGGASTPGGLIKDNIFDSNYAAKHGGAIDWYRSYNSVMDNCTFINNSALKDGGAFYIGDTEGKGKNITLTDCKFINNTAGYAGGAISNQMSDSHFINSTFIGNKAVFGGSVIMKDAVTVNNEIIGCTFINSVAIDDLKSDIQVRGKGGAIFARDNKISVYDSTFINCTALEGGAIYWNGGMNYKNTNSSSLHNTKYLGINGLVSNSEFLNNTAVRGGAVYWQATNGTIKDSKFTGNNATEGGALYWEGGVEYMNVQFNYPNTFVVHGENGKVYNSTFTQNTAQKGGAAYWTGTNGIIDDSTFVGNEANLGGAVYWNNITQTATYAASKTQEYTKTVSAGQNGLISNSMFFDNHAQGSDALGGALYWNTSSSDVADSTFLNNTADLGGAVYWVNGKSIDNSNFNYNKADNGSAMYVDKSAPRMDIIGSKFLENRANANRFDPLILEVNDDEKTVSLVAYFRGNDNIINAIYNDGENNVYFTDVTYLGVDGIRNTGKNSPVVPEKIDGAPENPNKIYQTDYEIFQTVDVTLYGTNNKELVRKQMKTDSEGKISLYYDDMDVDKASLKLKIQHPEDNYYTYLVHVEGANLTSVFIETADIYCLDDEIINITVVPQDDSKMVAPTGNISIWIKGKLFKDNVQLINEEGSRCATATVIVPKCPTGIYDVFVKYNGDDDYLPEENTSSFKVLEIDDSIIVETVDIKVGEIEPIIITVFPSNKVTGVVSVYLDSKYIGEYPLVDGKVQIDREGLLAGKHNVIAFYNGDSNFNRVSNTSSFMVSKHDPNFIINAKDIFVYDNGFILINLPENATGFVYLKVNGTAYYLNLTNGERSINIPPLDEGIYEVWGNYSGDNYWNSVVNTTTFKVSKYNITLDVQTADIVYGEKEMLNVTMEFSDATGNVTIRINDTLRVFENVPIVDGVARIDVTGLVPGYYAVDVIYPGDKKYNGNTTKGSFIVDKAHIPIIIVPQNFTFLEKGMAYIYVNTTGEVNATIADVVKNTRTLLNGEVSYDLKDLDPGIYTITAHFSGNDYYYPSNNETIFEVYKLNRTVDVVVHDIVYGNYEDIQVFVKANGNVTIFVNSENGTFELKDPGYGSQGGSSVGHNQEFNGKTVWNIFDLPVGTYPVKVDYHGNKYYFPASGEAVFRVIPANTTVTIDAHDIKVWDSEYLNVTVRNANGKIMTDAVGNITLDIDGVIYSEKIVNGIARFVIPDLSVGDKEVWAYYDGDRNHNGNKSRATFNVGQRNPIVNVTGQDIYVGQTENVHIEIPANATGYVVLTTSFFDYAIQITEFDGGKADLAFDNLAVGNYSVHIKYYGDEYDNYTVGEADGKFTVSPIDTPIDIVVESIFYKQIADITVNVNADATGFITINVVNKSGIIREIKLPVFNGSVNYMVDNLAVDNYTVYAVYSGDERYNPNKTVNEFEVKKIAPEIIIDSVEANAKDNATVIVHITPGTTGVVEITVDNKVYSGQINNGIATIVVDQLNPGNYTVYAYYAGDRNYTEASTSAANAINVAKIDDYEITVTAEDTKVGLNSTIVVTVPTDAEGEVAIYVNGTWVGNATIEDGIAKLNVTQEISGKYIVDVTFSDDQYSEKTATTDYYVSKWDTPIIITVEDKDNIYVGDVVKIIVNVPEDVKENVTIKIDGRTYTNKTYGGNATFYVPDLVYGNKTVVAIYDGDNKYVFNSTTDDFTVRKNETEVPIEPEVPIDPVVPTEPEVPVEPEVPIEPEVPVEPEVPTPKDDIIIFVEAYDIYVGATELINVTLPDGATGNVLIEIDGLLYEPVAVDYNVQRFAVENLNAGGKTVVAHYSGDDRYLPKNASDSFNVFKLPSFVIPIAEDIYVGELENIQLKVPVDAVGNVTVVIDGEIFTFDLGEDVLAAAYIQGNKYYVAVSGGNGVLVISDLPEGDYVVSARYNGDEKYLPAINDTVFKVIPFIPPEIIEENNTPTNLELTENETEPVSVPEDPVITPIYQIPEDEGINAEFFNNTKPIAETPETVNDAPISANAHDIYVGETETVIVTVPNDATGTVTIEIDSIKYSTSEIIDGKATFKVDGLTAGDKTVIVIYSGDDKYPTNTTTANFSVNKLPSTVDATGNDIVVGDEEIIEITVPEDATGTITVEIEGVKYSTTEIVDGKAKIVIPELPAGDYTAIVYYEGNDKYLPSNSTVTFKVSDVENQTVDDDEEIDVDDSDDVDEDDTEDIVVDEIEVEDSDDVVIEDAVPAKENHSEKSSPRENVGLSQYETGNPILVLLLMLLVAVGSSQIRRFK